MVDGVCKVPDGIIFQTSFQLLTQEWAYWFQGEALGEGYTITHESWISLSRASASKVEDLAMTA